jgi:hypothetical protein
MDKVQIYYMVMFALTVIIRTGRAIYDPEGVESGTHKSNFKIFILGLPLSLPLAGRIFGWW